MSTAPPILVIPIGAATEQDIALCRAAGVVVLAVADPSQVRFVELPIREPNVVRVCVAIANELARGKHVSPMDARARIVDAVMESAEVQGLTKVQTMVTP